MRRNALILVIMLVLYGSMRACVETAEAIRAMQVANTEYEV